MEDKLIYKRRLEDEVDRGVWKLWIPESLTAGLIVQAHEEPTSGHGRKEDAAKAAETVLLAGHGDSGSRFRKAHTVQGGECPKSPHVGRNRTRSGYREESI